MNILRQWAVSLIISGMAGAVISLLSPRGTMEKTLRAVIGIFMVSAVCSPLTDILKEDVLLSLPATEHVTVEADNSLNEYMLDSLNNTVEGTVKSAAATLGIADCEIGTDAYIDEYSCIIIRNIHITIPSEFSESADDFAEILEKKLGVTVGVECR
ncbi:MAG: stage III sporulation protein AF [Clostridia bacterium]|nr:stage III sporulation protein AF [Clostridia bacterium]